MKLFNTLTRQVDEFTPQEQGKATIYSCGPTVYDNIHIGNLASFIYADTLRRTVKASGLQTKHVMNFTDVDDKTIRKSKEKLPTEDPMKALLQVTGDYSDIFLADMKAVGNNVDDITFVKATDSIKEMQQIINELLDAGIAYHSDDGVYFSISAYKEHGKKYGQLTDVTVNSTSQARIQNDEYDKESAHDFALWKLQKDGEPAWDFEISGQNLKGRPGWHIECSAMSKAALGQPFDIHTGGVDLIFPHHENEIAQSTANTESDRLANYFVHNEHILIDGKKMSKSLNNFYTLKDITEKGFDPLAFRLLVLQAHYRNQAHFSWDNLEAAHNRLADFRAMSALRFQLTKTDSNNFLGGADFDAYFSQILKAATEDMKISQALVTINTVAEELSFFRGTDKAALESFVLKIDALLGLGLGAVQDITDNQKQLLMAREQAREAKDWAEADKIRAELESQDVGVRDTEHGSIWFPL